MVFCQASSLFQIVYCLGPRWFIRKCPRATHHFSRFVHLAFVNLIRIFFYQISWLSQDTQTGALFRPTNKGSSANSTQSITVLLVWSDWTRFLFGICRWPLSSAIIFVMAYLDRVNNCSRHFCADSQERKLARLILSQLRKCYLFLPPRSPLVCESHIADLWIQKNPNNYDSKGWFLWTTELDTVHISLHDNRVLWAGIATDSGFSVVIFGSQFLPDC